MRRALQLGVIALAAVVAGAAITLDATDAKAGAETFNPADFSADITNPLFPQPVGTTRVFEGEDEGAEIRVEETVLAKTRVIHGIKVRVVEVNEFEDGELVEHTLDFYAQHEDGSVWYFGELVDNFEDGVLVDHAGQWLAFEGENLPGLFMPADPEVGDVFEQERAPGVAEDISEVIKVGVKVKTPIGTFTGCIQTEDFNPLDGAVENKYYCPGVGLVRETAQHVLVELTELG
jgi:hypothetical protein